MRSEPFVNQSKTFRVRRYEFLHLLFREMITISLMVGCVGEVGSMIVGHIDNIRLTVRHLVEMSLKLGEIRLGESNTQR